MNEFIEQFLIEARELVEQATNDLLALEAHPTDRDRLDGAFRAFHTLKGAAGIVEFDAMGRALHAAEDVLATVRDGSGAVTVSLIEDSLWCLDHVVQWLDEIEKTGVVPTNADAAANAIAARFTGGSVTQPATVAQPSDDLSGIAFELIDAQREMLMASGRDGLLGRIGSAARVATNVLRHAGQASHAANIEAARVASDEASSAGPLLGCLESILNGETLSEAAKDALPSSEGPGARSLRVDVERIERLVALTGELTVAKNAIGFLVTQAQQSGDIRVMLAKMKDEHAVLSRLVTELQRAVLQVRVLPLRHVFQRLPRIVRDLAGSLGKQVRLEIVGEETEADKAIVESLFEPLLHVVRNAIDHGVEMPKDRLQSGKPAIAVLRVSATRQGDRIAIDVRDDGRGINVARIRDIALERGLRDADELQVITEAELLDLIFLPGFSTAREVSDVSGRGVGMDVVRTAVARMGGRVALDSAPGQGTSVRFMLPYTVLLTQVMTIEACGQIFGLPLDSVVETVRISRSEVQPVGSAHAFVWRGMTLPIVSLADLLGQPIAPLKSDEACVVVVSAAGQLAGVEVRRLGERLEVMLKPMEGLMASTRGIGGTTVLGDGRILLVLDVQEMLDKPQ